MSQALQHLLSKFELGTFAGLPGKPSDDRPTRAAILGLPFDTGTNGFRIGSRQGPNHIRASHLPDRRFLFNSERDFLNELGVVDLGNIQLTPSKLEDAFEKIEAALSAVYDSGAVPVSLGGDGSVTLPQLRAAYKKYGPLSVIHCDAHTDTSDVEGAGPYTTTTTFLRAAEEGILDAESTYHVGARGTLSSLSGARKKINGTGHRIIPMDEFIGEGPGNVGERLHGEIGDRPVYICWDMDFFDPSVAPGVAMPEWGGASAREGLTFLNSLSQLNTVSFDINTVSPPHDIQGLTGQLAGRVILEFLNGLPVKD
ncbi:arginase family protein [Paenarthrobacter nitroguajacolicus]